MNIGQQVLIIADIYEDGIEQVACKGEVGIIRAFSTDGRALVEFQIGRVVALHPSCFSEHKG